MKGQSIMAESTKARNKSNPITQEVIETLIKEYDSKSLTELKDKFGISYVVLSKLIKFLNNKYTREDGTELFPKKEKKGKKVVKDDDIIAMMDKISIVKKK